MKKVLMQVEGEPDSCKGCEFLLCTSDSCLCKRNLKKGETCDGSLIYKLLEPKKTTVSRKRSNKSKSEDNGKS